MRPDADTTGMDVVRLMQREAELGAVTPVPQQRRPVPPALFISDEEKEYVVEELTVQAFDGESGTPVAAATFPQGADSREWERSVEAEHGRPVRFELHKPLDVL